MYEIRWHSRAGHGAITAANALCEIVAKFSSDYESQAFPDYGAEKKGAPVLVYNRFDKDRILETYHVEHPDLVLLLDTSLINENELSYQDVLSGLKPQGALLLNTLQDKTKFNDQHEGSVYHLPATPISTEEIGRNIPNVPMLGGLLKISQIMPIDEFIPHLKNFLSSALPEKIVEGNLRALQRGYDEVRKVK